MTSSRLAEAAGWLAANDIAATVEANGIDGEIAVLRPDASVAGSLITAQAVQIATALRGFGFRHVAVDLDLDPAL